jgi:hypothetical protein
MVIFGLVLLLLAVLIVIAVVAHGGDPASLDLQLFTIKTSVTGVFVAGAITLLLAVLGLALVLGGLRHDRRRRGEIKELKKRAGRRDRGSQSKSTATPTATSGSPPRPSGAGSTTGVTTGSTSGSTTGSTGGSSTGSTDGSSSGTSTPVQREPGDEPDGYFDSAPRDR